MTKCYEFRFVLPTFTFTKVEMVGLAFDTTAARARRRIAKHLKKCNGELRNFQRIDIDDNLHVLGELR